MRLGLLARIILIVAVALFAIQLAVLLLNFGVSDGRAPAGGASPAFSRQVASLVKLVDEAPPALRPAILEAFSETGRTASIVPALPDGLTRQATLIRVERAIRAALASRDLADRGVWVRLDERDGDRRRDTLSVFVRLATGDYLWLDVEDRVTVRVLGIPIGFFAGLFGVLVAIAALLAVARETRPLSHLAREVDRIGENGDPVPIPERGAPELRTLIRAVNAMQLRIAALLRNRTLTLGAISHDLRTYLTRLRLRVEMMPESRHRAGAVADVEAMQALVEDTLDFAQDAFFSGEASSTDLAALVRDYCEGHAQAARIVVDLPAGPIPVRVDAKSLRRICVNLVENALAYADRAFLRVERTAQGVDLVIDDDGPGIPPEERERVFEPFYRLEGSRNRESGGTGLGLTIVRRIVQRHGGAVALDRSPLGGLRVRVSLPAG
ncbi:ATP-binding protein [Ancylobacter sp. TS-1]|uniref:ATP-binding protein n=1 Tax=Ancylobacter sp. TS-1 TaxID=1850374 RepID=UPI001265D099|nr:ATP-binding protein [Ancylobacter sp. TS-1]QFR32672.1 HAMP domain-containing protein [Ancylobacter sp. TS-1]